MTIIECTDATPSTQNLDLEALLLDLDDSHSQLYKLHAQGEYAKLSDVSDIILDIRQKIKARVSR